MIAPELAEGVYAVGVKDWNATDFHGYPVSRGITYNAYLVRGEKTALIDTVKEKFADELIQNISKLGTFDMIDYVVCNHIEMDHSGAVPRIMALAKNAVLLTSAKGKEILEKHYDTAGFKIIVVKTGDRIDLGGKTLQFVQTPMLHWPDSMETYLPEHRILFSNDGFGQHFATAQYFDDKNLDLIMEQAAGYYANILLLFDKPAKAALTALKNLPIAIVAPSHGVIWRDNVDKIMDKYAFWADGGNKNKAVIIYDSMWGATEIMAGKVRDAFCDGGTETSFRSLRTAPFSDVMGEILEAKYIAVGSAALNNGLLPSVIRFLGYMEGLRPQRKTGLAFGSYGWKPEILKKIDGVFDNLGWNKLPLYAINFRPLPEQLQELYDTVRRAI